MNSIFNTQTAKAAGYLTALYVFIGNVTQEHVDMFMKNIVFSTSVAAGAFIIKSSLFLNVFTKSSNPVKPVVETVIPIVNSDKTDKSYLVTVPKASDIYNEIPDTGISDTYIIMISDIAQGGASAVFFFTGAHNLGSEISRIVSSKGTETQSLDVKWNRISKKLEFRHEKPINSVGVYTYQVKVVSCI